ncbi:MAG: hypothetical protein QW223_01535 [Candidatus Caldarchaeum sp.]
MPRKVSQDRISKWLGLSDSYFDEHLGREVHYRLTSSWRESLRGCSE